MGRKFEFRKLVDFCDVDLGGGLYHPNYYKYLDTARVTALSEVGVSFKAFFERNTALVVVSIDSRFIAPAFFEDNLKIVT
jgi:acyl-CoA thioester hydrolase